MAPDATAQIHDALNDFPFLQALKQFEEAGLVKKITLLNPSSNLPSSAFTGPQLAGLGPNLQKVFSGLGTDGSRQDQAVSFVQVQRPEDLRKLQDISQSDSSLEFVSAVPSRYLCSDSSTRRNRPRQQPAQPDSMWNLRKIAWHKARALEGFKDANQVRVAILDSGVDPLHPDLLGCVKDYIFQDPAQSVLTSDKDFVGHGTHIAGTIAASINNDIGINGICNCSVHVWKILSDETIFSEADNRYVYVIDPILYRGALAACLSRGIDVANLSFGGLGKADPLESSLIQTLLNQGTSVVSAMGNERMHGSPVSYPAALPDVIAVGATTVNDRVASFSSRGDHITITAPGVGIWSTLPTYHGQTAYLALKDPQGIPLRGKALIRETDYDVLDGTSMAAPHVTAAVALLTANKGKHSSKQIKSEVQAAAEKVDGMNGKDFTPDYGAGRLNLATLLG